jgi:hypothetical protein
MFRFEKQLSFFPLFELLWYWTFENVSRGSRVCFRCLTAPVVMSRNLRRRIRQIKTIDFLNKFIFYFRKLRRSMLFTLFLMHSENKGPEALAPYKQPVTSRETKTRSLVIKRVLKKVVYQLSLFRVVDPLVLLPNHGCCNHRCCRRTYSASETQ